MKRETVWLLLQEGFNANEIAAAARIGVQVADALVDNVLHEARRPVRGFGMSPKQTALPPTRPIEQGDMQCN